MKKIDNPFISIYPTIDLHGETADISAVLVKEFIDDNVKLKNTTVVIIHGKGNGIVRKSVENYLKYDKRVLEYKLDNFNDGVTVVKLGGF